LNTRSEIRLSSRSASGLRFGLVKVRVSNAILRKNNRHTGAMSVTFRAGIVWFGIRKNNVNMLEVKIGYGIMLRV